MTVGDLVWVLGSRVFGVIVGHRCRNDNNDCTNNNYDNCVFDVFAGGETRTHMQAQLVTESTNGNKE